MPSTFISMRLLLLITITIIISFSCNKTSEIPVVINSVTPMKDGPGAPITILGTGFGTDSAACTVLFSGKPATIESFSDTKLIVRVPSNATNGKIEVRVKSQSVLTTNDFILLSGIWNRKSDFPGAGRTNLVSFTIGNKAYVGLGDSNGPFYNDLYEYDASTNSWTKKANLPGPGLNRATAIAAAGKGYIICGTEPGSIIKNDLWEYNPSSNAWTKKADFPGVGRFYAAGFSVNDKIYFGAGQVPISGGSSILTDWWEYNPGTNAWTQKKELPFGSIIMPHALTIGTKGYLGASEFSSNSFWEYDATSDTWKSLSNYPGNKNLYSSSFTINGKAYVVAGTGNECWEFDPANNTWTQRTSHPYNRTGGIGFAIGNKGYLTTGSSMTYLDKDIWEFSLQ